MGALWSGGCGQPGEASAGNALIAAMLQSLGEGMLLATRAGVDPSKLLEVVQASGFRSPYFDFKGQALLRRDFETHFAIDLMHKDPGLFLDSAERAPRAHPDCRCACASATRRPAPREGQQDIGAPSSPPSSSWWAWRSDPSG